MTADLLPDGSFSKNERRKYMQKRPWLVLWDILDFYPKHLTDSERKLLKKLDRTILPWTMLTFFIKYLDQSNVTNAYVTNMKEDLNLNGNELNWFNTYFFIGYVIAQVPLILMLSRPKVIRIGLPTLELAWGTLTLLQSIVKKPQHLYVIRFFMGIMEAPVFGTTHFVLGSWYSRSELFKRAGLWFTGNSLGSLFAGVMQTAAYKNLDGVCGRAGWRWGFIIDGIITLPIAAIGYLVFPGLPDSPRAKLILTENDISIARSRNISASPQKIRISTIIRCLKKWEWWLCVIIYVFLIQMSIPSSYMALWLKSEPNGHVFSDTQINNYPSLFYALTALVSWIGTSLATVYPSWMIYTACSIPPIFSYIIMIIWNVPNGLKTIAWILYGFLGALSPLLYSWVNIQFNDDREFRAFVIGSMMTIGYSTYIWTPLLVFQTGGDAPRWKIGWPYALGCFIILYLLMMTFYYLTRNRRNLFDDERDIKDIEPYRGASNEGSIEDFNLKEDYIVRTEKLDRVDRI